jgi:hypothetical protein
MTTMVESPDTTTDTGAEPRAAKRAMVASMAWDLGPSVAAYYGARALGFSEYVSLLAGTVASGLRVGWVAVRNRRLDPFATVLLVLFGVGFVLTFLTGDARLMLAKDAATSMLAGLLFLGSCAIHRPLTYYAARRMAGPAGQDKVRARFADPATSGVFYRGSLVWGGGLLADAVARIAVIYLLPLDVAVGVSSALMVAAYTVLIGWTIRYARRELSEAN